MLNTESSYQNLENIIYQPDHREIFRGGEKMTFVNEYISNEDREKYNIDEIDKRFPVGATHSPQWTVDKERDIYLRCVSRGREDIAHRSRWTFFWKGELIVLELDLLQAKGYPGEPGWSHKRIRKLTIPEQLKPRKAEILSDLKEAFLAHKDGGVFSKTTSYSLTLDVVEGE